MNSREDLKNILFDKIQDFPGYWEPCKHNQTRTRCRVVICCFPGGLGAYLNHPLCIMAIGQKKKKKGRGAGGRWKKNCSTEEVCHPINRPWGPEQKGPQSGWVPPPSAWEGWAAPRWEGRAGFGGGSLLRSGTSPGILSTRTQSRILPVKRTKKKGWGNCQLATITVMEQDWGGEGEAASPAAVTHRQRLPEEESPLHSRVVGHLKYYLDALWVTGGRLGRETLGLPLLLRFKVLTWHNTRPTRTGLNPKLLVFTSVEVNCRTQKCFLWSSHRWRQTHPPSPLLSQSALSNLLLLLPLLLLLLPLFPVLLLVGAQGLQVGLVLLLPQHLGLVPLLAGETIEWISTLRLFELQLYGFKILYIPIPPPLSPSKQIWTRHWG